MQWSIPNCILIPFCSVYFRERLVRIFFMYKTVSFTLFIRQFAYFFKRSRKQNQEESKFIWLPITWDYFSICLFRGQHVNKVLLRKKQKQKNKTSTVKFASWQVDQSAIEKRFRPTKKIKIKELLYTWRWHEPWDLFMPARTNACESEQIHLKWFLQMSQLQAPY